MSILGTNAAQAASAYAQTASRPLEENGAGIADGAASKGPTFTELVEDKVGAAIGANRKAESVSLDAINGKADMVDLVTAMNNAEMTLQTVVAVRDRVVQAYQDILKMPI